MNNSEQLFNSAQNSIPGGVNSPVRAFRAVGGTPLFIDHAKGSYLFDVDGKRYIDYVLSWGPMILGHAHEEIINAVTDRLRSGLSFGAPTEIETLVAEEISNLVPGIDLLRMVSSGTEATMSAIRLARGYTGRDDIVKFEGCYHGHSDSLLVKAGSGALTHGVPSSPGVPAGLAKHTLTLPFNDLDACRELFAQKGDSIACVIVEPIAGNMNCIPPMPDFLQGLRDLCTQYEAVLIFDEVMTGFRVSLSGAQGLYDVQPDLTTFGKVVGGGMPVGAFGGKRQIMEQISPLGPVYQAGTLSGNPIAMAAGLTTLKVVQRTGFYEELSIVTNQLVEGLLEVAKLTDTPMTTNHVCGMFGFFFSEESKITNFQQVMACDNEKFNRFFHGMLRRGINFAPASYEASFTSIAHSQADVEFTLEKATETLREIG